ncbi:MAG: ABC transporter substrate-binding protein [Novosphingobium sp.]|nr:ABC transporter substrate-binding protein [Novosphingobium sp.]
MADPLLIGILSDMSAAEPADDSSRQFESFVRLSLDPIIASGRIDREVKFVSAYGLGLPGGTAHAVEGAFAELEAQGVLAILGPAIGDNALVATPLADRYQVPTINYAGTERARSDWMFHLQVGSHEDEGVIIARHLKRLGIDRIGVVFDKSPIGRRYFSFLQAECDDLGILVATSISIAPEPADAVDQIAVIKSAHVDAVVYLGLGLALPAVSEAMQEAGVDQTRIMNTAGLWGYRPGFAEKMDGWIYLDMIADDNKMLAEVRQKLPAGTPFQTRVGFVYDLGTLLGEGLARSSEFTRHGVREGLELIKWLPAAEGHDGTMLSFGNFDHGALHGRYLVLRRWLAGQSVEIKV